MHEILEKLKSFQKIIVTGPQRSGTTIAAKIISYELEYQYLVEEIFDVENLAKFFEVCHNNTKFVLQAPTVSAYCHLIPEVAVVFMKRNLQDIKKSEQRIGWAHEKLEKSKYFDESDKPIAETKYWAWEKFQKPILRTRGFELEYSSLENHSLWVEKDLRKRFGPRQTDFNEFAKLL